jgi:hypothetical protein
MVRDVRQSETGIGDGEIDWLTVAKRAMVAKSTEVSGNKKGTCKGDCK